MKKLFSFSALYALLYAMPMSANFSCGLLLSATPLSSFYEHTVLIVFPMLLIVLIQALLLRYYLKNISYTQALITTCVGNIPSTILGLFPVAINLFDWYFKIADAIMKAVGGTPFAWSEARVLALFFIALTNTVLMLLALAIVYHYPIPKLIIPVLLGNIAAYAILYGLILLLAAC